MLKLLNYYCHVLNQLGRINPRLCRWLVEKVLYQIRCTMWIDQIEPRIRVHMVKCLILSSCGYLALLQICADAGTKMDASASYP